MYIIKYRTRRTKDHPSTFYWVVWGCGKTAEPVATYSNIEDACELVFG